MLLIPSSVGVMANTTSLASAQLTLTSQASLVDIISDYYGEGLFPALLCPPPLFLEIIRINALRAQAVHSELPVASSLERAATELVHRLLDFKPQAWANIQTSRYGDGGAELWLLLGHVYQSAVTLYAIASLQSLAVLAHSSHLDTTLCKHRDSLVSCLRTAVLAPEIKMWMMWPLVVAGLLAGRCEDVRGFVKTELTMMARALGTPLPLAARSALERFWARDEMGWDGCFDSAFAFVT